MGTGFSPLLDRGFVIAAALDCAGDLGLQNLSFLEGEMQKETQKMQSYFSKDRDNDDTTRITSDPIRFR